MCGKCRSIRPKSVMFDRDLLEGDTAFPAVLIEDLETIPVFAPDQAQFQ